MTETKHTPTPWMADVDIACTFDDDGRREFVIEITNLDHSATVAYAVPGYENQIVTACNAHDQLVEAARMILKHLDANAISIYDNETCDYCAGSDIVGFYELASALESVGRNG